MYYRIIYICHVLYLLLYYRGLLSCLHCFYMFLLLWLFTLWYIVFLSSIYLVHNTTRCIWQYYWWSALTSAIVPTKVYVFWYLPFYYKELVYTAQLLRCRNVCLLIRRWRGASLVVVVVVRQVSESSQAPNTGRRKP